MNGYTNNRRLAQGQHIGVLLRDPSSELFNEIKQAKAKGEQVYLKSEPCSFSSFDSVAVEQLKLELASARAMETVLRARLERAQRALDEATD